MTPGVPRTSDAPLYWDPLAHLDSLIGQVYAGGSGHRIPPADQIFHGTWSDRNWRNVPGPFYGAMTDNCWVGGLYAPHHVLYGDDEDYEQEFLFRQPKNQPDLLRVLAGMSQDPWAGWARDGDSHWTPELVTAWWDDRSRIVEWIHRKCRQWNTMTADDRDKQILVPLWEYRDYIDGELEGDLRVYCFWLQEGRSPTIDDNLPAL